MNFFGLASRICGLAFFLIAVGPANAVASDCLDYEPTQVQINGKIVRRTFPGPPNYEDVHHGDAAEEYWFLVPSKPICVDQSKQDPEIDVAKTDIREIQLVVLDSRNYRQYKSLVGKNVVATGTLSGAITGHHHTPVLLTVTTLSKDDGRAASH